MVLGGWLARGDRYLRHNPPWFQKVLHKVNEDDDNKDRVNKCHPSIDVVCLCTALTKWK